MVRILVLMLLLLSFRFSFNGEESDQAQEESSKSFMPAIKVNQKMTQDIILPKDPILSAFLSVSIPGLGQLYVNEYLKAGLFFMGSVAPFLYLQYMQYLPSDTVFVRATDSSIYKIILSQKKELTTEQKIISGAAVLVWSWTVIDAYLGAKKHNLKLLGIPQKNSFKLELDGFNTPNVKLSYHF